MRDCELSEAQRMYAIAQFEGGSSTAKISNALNCRKARATVSREVSRAQSSIDLTRMYLHVHFANSSCAACSKFRNFTERYYSYGYRLDTYDFATTYNY